MKAPLARAVVRPLLLLSLVPAPIWAQSVQNIVLRNSFSPLGAGARGLGMGGAFIGVADDGTAASFNPAGLAQLRRTEIAAVGFTEWQQTHRTDVVQGQSVTDNTSHTRPDFLAVGVPFEVGGRHLTVQFSYQRAIDLFGKGAATTRDFVPFRDLKLNLPGTALLTGQIVPQQAGAFQMLSTTTGYQLTQRLLLGLSFNYWIAGWTADGLTSFRTETTSVKPVTVSLDDRTFHQKQSLRGLNLNLGLLLKYPRVSVGAVGRLPFSGRYTLDETGTATTTAIGSPTLTAPVREQLATQLEWPFSGGLGLAVRPFGRMTIAFDFAKAYWSRATLLDVVDGALLTPKDAAVAGVEPQPSLTNRNFFDLNPASLTTTDDTVQIRGGAEYLFTPSKLVIPVRVGLFRDQSPVRDLNKDQGRRVNGFTLGTGLNFSHVVLDLAFEHLSSEGVVGLQTRRGQTSAAATETVSGHRVVASVIVRLSENDPIKRALRALFVGPKETSED